ncbi:EnvZ/OmpR regulon moderator, partial [Salmonella enterica subsp. enterica serovar Poona]
MLKPRITARQLIWISAFLLMLTILMMTWSTLRQQESPLALRAGYEGARMADGLGVLQQRRAAGGA